MSSAVVTFNGRITLPNNVRKQLGLKTGDSVDFVEIEHGRFAITHGPEPAADPASIEASAAESPRPRLHVSNARS